MYQKNDKNILQKWALICQLNVAMAHRNYFWQNNVWILKLATYQRLKITISGANWQLFRLERIAKCSYFILSTQNIKFYWFVKKCGLQSAHKISTKIFQFSDIHQSNSLEVRCPFLYMLNLIRPTACDYIWTNGQHC